MNVPPQLSHRVRTERVIAGARVALATAGLFGVWWDPGQPTHAVAITYTLSAGVGEVGLRGLQLARINTLELGLLKLRNVPCLVKDPPLRDLPTREQESLSPLNLGF